MGRTTGHACKGFRHTCKLPIATVEGGGKSEEETEVQASMPMFIAVLSDSSQELEAAKVLHSWRSEQTQPAEHTSGGFLLCLKKEGHADIYHNMCGPGVETQAVRLHSWGCAERQWEGGCYLGR